ncbi:STAS domain-containing protein [Paraconexibacter sp.]|uniref:STAS domain-containing protein n=1 Tax=Paraconexibacter sp. TaxID=2949640 RepID=UPI003561BABD
MLSAVLMNVPSPVTITVETLPDATGVVSVDGEIDLATSADLEARVREHVAADGPRTVVIDLAACGFLDSTGVAALLRLHGELAERTIGLVLVAPPGPVLRVLSLMGIEQRLAVVPDRAAALQSPDAI